MATVVRMPAALAGATEGAIQTWLATEGQTIAVGDPLAEIETEKATVEYAAEVAGTVGKLLAEPGQNVAVGDPIAVILGDGEGVDAVGPALASAGVAAAEPAPAQPAPADAAAVAAPEATSSAAPTASEPQPAPGAESAAAESGGRVFASPIVRRLAKERGVGLESLSGSGPGGRIVRRDLDAAAGSVAPAPSITPASPSAAPATSAAGSGAAATYTDIPLTRMRKAIARRLTESKTTVPHFYVTAHCRVDRLMSLRAEANEVSPRKLSVNDFVLKAVALALHEVPEANVTWNGDSIRRYDGVDLAVAVAIDGGLTTPVLRGVHALTVGEISAQVADLAERARAGSLLQHELEGGSFSVSNLGMYGVDEFSAILNPPHSGILAVSAAKQQPVVEHDQVVVGTVMTVTLSADHRAVDGAVAAQWIRRFTELIEHPVGLLL
jgi:pyruvate dehydrogenase E2 component (dihydrolipoamide acetyltransferase)